YGTLNADVRVSSLASQWRLRYGGEQSAMVDFVTGSSAYARSEYAQAVTLFQTAANVAGTLAERRASLYNAGLAALRTGEMALYQSILGQLEIVSAGAPALVKSGDAATDLELDRALDQASRRQPSASDDLRAFIQKYPEHPRLAEAHLALAETLLMQIPTDFP